jgi:hypothetical protein
VITWEASVRQKVRPRSVTLAATLQLLLAAAFVLSVTVDLMFGADADAAAQAEVVRQGFPAGILAGNNVTFDSSAIETALPVAIILIVTTLAVLNLAGNRAGRILSWICQPLIIFGGVTLIVGQVFVTQMIEKAFQDSGDPALKSVNVQAFVDAAGHVFPAWLSAVIYAKFVLATLGSLLVIILLAVPSANIYFRKEPILT